MLRKVAFALPLPNWKLPGFSLMNFKTTSTCCGLNVLTSCLSVAPGPGSNNFTSVLLTIPLTTSRTPSPCPASAMVLACCLKIVSKMVASALVAVARVASGTLPRGMVPIFEPLKTLKRGSSPGSRVPLTPAIGFPSIPLVLRNLNVVVG
jgi:hypothetical protein